MPTPLAYLDTFSGLVPCHVESVETVAPGVFGYPLSEDVAHIILTGTRGDYSRGERLTVPVRVLVSRRTRTRSGNVYVIPWQA